MANSYTLVPNPTKGQHKALQLGAARASQQQQLQETEKVEAVGDLAGSIVHCAASTASIF